MKASILCAVLLTSFFPTARAADALPAVRLIAGEKQVGLAEGTQERLRQQITDLVKSSNFHSGPGDKYHIFTFSGVQQDYRDTVASGEYLLMRLSPAQKIATLEGEVTAAEIVVGLRLHGSGGRNTVFTIDESGTIISHAKYSGEIYLELMKTVAQSRR
jgi:hypothetical protein